MVTAPAQLPSGWRQAKIGDLFDSWGGHTPSKADSSYWGDGLPWVSSKEVKAARLRTSTYTVTKKAVDETGLHICPTGSVLVVVRSGILAHTLPVAVTETPVTINQDLKAFYSDEPLLNEWLALFLRMSAHELLASSRRDGTTVQSIQYPLLKNTLIPVPPTEERRRIIEAVEEVLAKQGAVPAHLASARRAIERFRQAVLASACSGRLTSDWRDAHPSGESADDLIKQSASVSEAARRQPTDAGDWSEPDWLGLPESWRWAPLSKLAVVKGGIQKQPIRTPKKNAYPYLRVANVLRGRLDLSEVHKFELFGDELDTYRLEPGDLLVVEGNGSSSEIGRSALWGGEIADCVHQNHIIRVRCVSMEPRFVDLFWNSPIGSREISSLAVTSSGLYSLSTKKVGAIPVPVAPLAEQREIVRRASELLTFADNLLRLVEKASHSVERSSHAVLAKAFRGDLLSTGADLSSVSKRS